VKRTEFDQYKSDDVVRTELAAKEQTTKHDAVLAAIAALEKSFDGKLTAAVDRLNTVGTEGFRETDAERRGREQATANILSAAKASAEGATANRRWLIGLAVTVTFGILANLLTFMALILHILKVF
jgi:hypothetical protein